MQYTQDNRQDELQQSSANYTPRSSYADDGSYQSELLRMSKEKEELEVQNRQLIDKHSELLIKYVIDIARNREWQLAYSLFLQDKLEADRTELQNRLRDMDAAVAQANETGRADYIMRTEIEHLKQDL